jgi:hypothetical protein
VPLPVPLDAPEQGQSPDDLTAEDRTSLRSDPAPLMPHQPAPILAILAPVPPPRDQMPADISPPINQKPPILSPDLVQPRPAPLLPMTAVPMPAAPVNQQAPILESTLPSPSPERQSRDEPDLPLPVEPVHHLISEPAPNPDRDMRPALPTLVPTPRQLMPLPALFPVPIQMPIQTPRHRSPRNQSLILLAPVIMPHMTAR